MQLLLLLITGASAAQCVLLNTDNDPRVRDGYVSLLTCRVSSVRSLWSCSWSFQFRTPQQGPARLEVLAGLDRSCDRRQAAGTDVIRSTAERAGATITEAEGSHAIMVSQPEAVAKVILTAAAAVGQAVRRSGGVAQSLTRW